MELRRPTRFALWVGISDSIDNVEPNVLAVVIYCRFDLPHGLKSDLSRSGHPSI